MERKSEAMVEEIKKHTSIADSKVRHHTRLYRRMFMHVLQDMQLHVRVHVYIATCSVHVSTMCKYVVLYDL